MSEQNEGQSVATGPAAGERSAETDRAKTQSRSRPQQGLLFEEHEGERTILDQLLQRAYLYRGSKEYMELLQFARKLRNFGPFNALLLRIQKPGLTFAASAYDWWHRFERTPKEDARPLIILWPFGPVALVYDIQDTEGKKLPKDTMAFYARGKINKERMLKFKTRLATKSIQCVFIDQGDGNAGKIACKGTVTTTRGKEVRCYRMALNKNHSPAVQFATMAHELAHLFLGHLGEDKELRVPQRPRGSEGQMEVEAESVAYLVCHRNGVKPNSERYLSNYVEGIDTVKRLDVYQVMRAAGQIEALLEVAVNTGFGPRRKPRRQRGKAGGEQGKPGRSG
jgi:hypothetical protein